MDKELKLKLAELVNYYSIFKRAKLEAEKNEEIYRDKIVNFLVTHERDVPIEIYLRTLRTL